MDKYVVNISKENNKYRYTIKTLIYEDDEVCIYENFESIMLYPTVLTAKNAAKCKIEKWKIDNKK